MDTHSVRDHAGRRPFQAPRHSFTRSGSPRRCQQRADSAAHHWSLPLAVSPVLPPVSFPQGDGWGVVLADLQCQVAGLKAQLHAPSSDPEPRPLGCGSGHGATGLPPPEAPGDDASIRSGGQLARFAPKWSGAPPLPASTVHWEFHWTWVSEPPALRLPSATQHQPHLQGPIQD